jgi:hypothetical protein
MENQTPRTQFNILQEFEFAKTPVMAAMMHTGEMIAIRPCVENMGLNWSGQLQAIKRNDRFDQLCVSVKAIALDGKSRDMVCLPPAVFQDWLWSLNPNSGNFNVDLWEQYKKGLVVHLLMMLKISLDEVKRLRKQEEKYLILLSDIKIMFQTTERKDEISAQVRELGKEEKSIKERILRRINIDPSQLQIDL